MYSVVYISIGIFHKKYRVNCDFISSFLKPRKPQRRMNDHTVLFEMRNETRRPWKREKRKKQKKPRSNCTDFKSRPFPNGSPFQPADAITFDFFLFSQHTPTCFQIVLAST